jgi:hypothetical protein
MKLCTLLRSLFVLSFLFLAGCRLLITVEGFGSIDSASGLYDCDTANTQCPYPLPAEDFNETFTAAAEPGHRFAGWDGWCFGSLNPVCNLVLPVDLVNLEFDWPITARFNPEIVGTWIYDDDTGLIPYGLATATFYNNGNYVITGPCLKTTAVNPAGAFEAGTYDYDPLTGDFSNLVFVSAGLGCGSRDDSDMPRVDNIVIEGDSMVFFVDGEIEATLQRLIPHEHDLLTGTWYIGDPLDPVATGFAQVSFINGTTYMIAEQCIDDALPPGLELGGYTWAPESKGAFSNATPPPIDTMGQCGFYDSLEPEEGVNRIRPSALSSLLKFWTTDGEKIKLQGVFF